jgi:hypothetical protein
LDGESARRKASTYTGEYHTEIADQHQASIGIGAHDVLALNCTYTAGATVIGKNFYQYPLKLKLREEESASLGAALKCVSFTHDVCLLARILNAF